ncbi:MAG: hypothetical protein WB948_14750 [Desulfobaccales bacterium]
MGREAQNRDGQNDPFVFEEASTIGRVDYIKVKEWVRVGPNHPAYKKLQGRPIPEEIGRIEGNSIDGYLYYEPKTNELNPTFVEKSLEILKEKIKAHRKKI